VYALSDFQVSIFLGAPLRVFAIVANVIFMIEYEKHQEGKGLGIAALILGCVSIIFSILTAIPGVV
jgi:hypothetical protein